MTEAGTRLLIIVSFGVVCVVAFVCAGVIISDMVWYSGISVHGCVLASFEALLVGAYGWIAWSVYHD